MGGRPFADRVDAGRALAARLLRDGVVSPEEEVVVLGLPRGGVVVAAEVAAALGGLLDVLLVRKVGLPIQPELAMGAIAAVGDEIETVRQENVLITAGVDDETFEAARAQEVAELRRRAEAYRDGRPPVPLEGRHVVVVDDGLATGATMRAAIAALRRRQPARITVAVPVGSPTACRTVAAGVDEVVCLWAPPDFAAVGQGYRNFRPTTDDEVRAALTGARPASAGSAGASDAG
ncbi:MAG TPA: phosphoribosyltransferase family protein [Geodermatophilus sp.]|nr:phosphoribosyltransferase family protein [Geodermatophilus sp.]